jgi:predicted lipoprotein
MRMPYRTNDRRRQDELRLEQQSLARGDALEYGAIAACRDRNKAAIAAAKAELEQEGIIERWNEPDGGMPCWYIALTKGEEGEEGEEA